jgi:hypothetical protein
MNINDLKILGFNASTMAISFTNIESGLKITFTMAVSIIYTVLKIIEMSNKNEADK